MDKITIPSDEGKVYFVSGWDEEMIPGEDANFVVGYFSTLLKASRAAERYALDTCGIEEDVSTGWGKADDPNSNPHVVSELTLGDGTLHIWVEAFQLDKILVEG